MPAPGIKALLEQDIAFKIDEEDTVDVQVPEGVGAVVAFDIGWIGGYYVLIGVVPLGPVTGDAIKLLRRLTALPI